jgi:hypothetical protein
MVNRKECFSWWRLSYLLFCPVRSQRHRRYSAPPCPVANCKGPFERTTEPGLDSSVWYSFSFGSWSHIQQSSDQEAPRWLWSSCMVLAFWDVVRLFPFVSIYWWGGIWKKGTNKWIEEWKLEDNEKLALIKALPTKHPNGLLAYHTGKKHSKGFLLNGCHYGLLTAQAWEKHYVLSLRGEGSLKLPPLLEDHRTGNLLPWTRCIQIKDIPIWESSIGNRPGLEIPARDVGRILAMFRYLFIWLPDHYGRLSSLFDQSVVCLTTSFVLLF